jgi:hypothetical protein
MTARKPRRKAASKAAVKPVGRPTKYSDKVPQQLVDYFLTCAETRPSVSTPVLKETFTVMPTMTGFAKKCGVTTRTLCNWREAHPEFEEAHEYAMAIAADMISQFAINNVYSPSISIFMLKANHGYQDRLEISTDSTIHIVLDDLQKGAI